MVDLFRKYDNACEKKRKQNTKELVARFGSQNFNMYGITREVVQYLWHFVPVPVPGSTSEE